MTLNPQTAQILDQLGRLEFTRFVVELECERAGTLPPFLGSTLRGSLAMALRRLVCPYGDLPCSRCHRLPDCDYPRLFEVNLPGRHAITGMRDTPHPIIIRPPLDALGCVSEGDLLPFCVTLIGSAASLWEVVLAACRVFPQVGLGHTRIPFRFVSAIGLDGREIANAQAPRSISGPVRQTLAESIGGHHEKGSLFLDLLTPLRLVHQGEMVRADVEPQVLLTAACRRLWALMNSVGGEDIDFRPLLDSTPFPRVRSQHLSWKPLERYSNRQSKSVDLSGLIGTVRWSGIDPGWWPILVAMREFHVGKGAVMGLGRVELRVL